MKKNKDGLLKQALDYCNENDKSTEFMIQYMQDFAKASHDEVINYLYQRWNKDQPHDR